jgi:site-specific DNA recombinase
MHRVASDSLECEPELCVVDDGYSGFILARPALERLRDQAAAGLVYRLYVLDSDRFSRKYAYQVLILEELTRCGIDVVFLRNPPGRGPEEKHAAEGPGYDRRVRARQDHGAMSPR